MIEPINPPSINPERHRQILDKIMPDVMELLEQIKTQLGGRLPEDLSYGIVAGYLHGRGHTWEEAFVGMHQWIRVMTQSYPETLKTIDGTMAIVANGDGTVAVTLKDKDGREAL